MGRWSETALPLGRIALALIALGVATSCSVFRASPAPRPAPVALPAPAQPFAIPHFDWPLAHGTLSSGFGVRHGAMHDGVDIAAPVGTPVMAAASGRVIFSGKMRGYGKIIIIQHDNHYVTVYAHDSTNLVREGDIVSRGQVIARVGRSGHTTGANLHFEVRHNNLASNPLLYLSPIRTTDTRLAAGPQY